MESVNVISFPFAGGNRYSLSNVTKYFPTNFLVNAYEPPGRGVRIKEKLIKDIDMLVEDARSWINPLLDKPYVIYGHSMGALIGYLVAKRIQEQGLPMPLHLVFTGSSSPISRTRTKTYYDLPKEEFLGELKRLGGCPAEVLNDRTIMDFFEPILRADFQIVDNYRYQPTAPFTIPITCIIGDLEEITQEDAAGWATETLGPFVLHTVSGDHFFINQCGLQIADIIISQFNQTQQLTKSTSYE